MNQTLSLKFNQLGHDEVVKILIKNGANVGQKAINGIIPLHCAAENGKCCWKSFQITHIQKVDHRPF